MAKKMVGLLMIVLSVLSGILALLLLLGSLMEHSQAGSFYGSLLGFVAVGLLVAGIAQRRAN